MTIMLVAGMWKNQAVAETARPESFIKVQDFISTTGVPASVLPLY